MADAASERLIDQTINDFVREGRMFSAADVAAEVRSRGGHAFERETAARLSQLFEAAGPTSNYTFTAVDVGVNEWQTIYHRRDDLRQYSPGDHAAPPPSPVSETNQPGIFSRLFQLFVGDWFRDPSTVEQPPLRFPAGQTTAADASKRSAAQPQKPPPRKSKTLSLEAGQLLPIERKELVQAAKGIQLWSSAFFGRRDLIPPAEDPRTNLIDRALVTHGMLSPEQLAEIHRVGAEMDRVRPQVESVRQQSRVAGAAAVDADRAERVRLKAEKKAAAAEKRQQRAERIAQRKATDIVYLGRGVSSRLGDRSSDVERLRGLGLPLLSTPAELAAALSISVPDLRWLAFHTEVATRTHYVSFTVPKRSGGVRTLSAPHKRLAAAQHWILHAILDKLSTEPNAHGFIAGRSILTNAIPHVGKQILVNMDLESFFPTIPFPRVRNVFQRCGYSSAVATILALLCTECPRRQVQYMGQTYFVATSARGLPQGACTSPALSNQVARRLDKRLQGLAAKLNLSFTRYADDLTFSGNDELRERVGYLMARVRHIAQDERFVVNEKKSRVLRRNASQQVTGIVVNDRPAAPRSEIRRLRAILHNAQRTGLEAQNRIGHPNFQAWLLGKIAYVRMTQPEVANKMVEQFGAARARQIK